MRQLVILLETPELFSTASIVNGSVPDDEEVVHLSLMHDKQLRNLIAMNAQIFVKEYNWDAKKNIYSSPQKGR